MGDHMSEAIEGSGAWLEGLRVWPFPLLWPHYQLCVGANLLLQLDWSWVL